MFDTNPPKANPKRETLQKKRNELSSRYSALSWSARDYDDKKGKGQYAKKHPDGQKLMNDLLEQKTNLDLEIAKLKEDDSGEDKPNVPVIGSAG